MTILIHKGQNKSLPNSVVLAPQCLTLIVTYYWTNGFSEYGQVVNVRRIEWGDFGCIRIFPYSTESIDPPSPDVDLHRCQSLRFYSPRGHGGDGSRRETQTSEEVGRQLQKKVRWQDYLSPKGMNSASMRHLPLTGTYPRLGGDLVRHTSTTQWSQGRTQWTGKHTYTDSNFRGAVSLPAPTLSAVPGTVGIQTCFLSLDMMNH